MLVSTLASAISLAQSSAGGGSIQGTVKDTTGAVIPNSRLTILHIDTGRATRTESNRDGFFSTPPISIGRYKIRVEAAGLKAWGGEGRLETGGIAGGKPMLAAGPVKQNRICSE